MSKALTHYIVAAYVADLQEVGFFLVPREFDGVEIAENWNMVGMRATESHDLVLNDVWVPKDFSQSQKKATTEWLDIAYSKYIFRIAQAARNYAIDFATSYGPNSIEGTISHLPTVQQNIGKMESLLLSARHFYGVPQKDIIIQKINHTYGMKHLLVKCQ